MFGGQHAGGERRNLQGVNVLGCPKSKVTEIMEPHMPDIPEKSSAQPLPLVSWTLEDVDTFDSSRHRQIGDGEPPSAIDGEGGRWVAVKGPSGMVKEVKEHWTKSREEKEERTETEDVQHLGDITDEESSPFFPALYPHPPFPRDIQGARDSRCQRSTGLVNIVINASQHRPKGDTDCKVDDGTTYASLEEMLISNPSSGFGESDKHTCWAKGSKSQTNAYYVGCWYYVHNLKDSLSRRELHLAEDTLAHKSV
ncbi:unnamed protein product [Bemisia tabaci]|uniref:Uncharacterized protein n=1 Tax=Bemisia tabaci TaxID=7038 RepID=A0A9P0EXI5_BEMTA|nr:unnamed protein product [Bemisia tabaci]